MNEPANLTAVIDQAGVTWVRVDDVPGAYGAWWPLYGGWYWSPNLQANIGSSCTWKGVAVYRPLAPADPDQAAAAVAQVRAQAHMDLDGVMDAFKEESGGRWG